MNFRRVAPIVLPALAFALTATGCDFDFGGVNSATTKSSPVLLDDGGVAQPNTMNGQNPCFVPCEGAYGTNCGWICQ